MFLADYPAELEANFGYSAAQSKAQAEKELADDLPLGLKTPNQLICCIEKDNESTLGYLWYTFDDDGATAFILDFVLYEQFRGMGFGKAALLALEKALADTSAMQIKLRVAGSNKRAFKLYERMGFKITDIKMTKTLEQSPADIESEDLGFTHREAKSGAILLSHHGMQVTTLRGKSAAEFLRKSAKLDFAGQQQLMARLTGNYKRGNERQGKNHPKNR